MTDSRETLANTVPVAGGPVVVASVPAGHSYVRFAIEGAPGVMVRPDPVLDPDAPQRWWPHPLVDPVTAVGLLEGVDVVHVHFGYEHRSPVQLAQWVRWLSGRGIPLVVTVHDLTNPHELSAERHRERTAELVRGAAAVVTLTRGAADEIVHRWGVRAEVCPHPPMLDSAVLTRWRRPPGVTPNPVVGVFLGMLRPGVQCADLAPDLARAAIVCGAVVRVMVRTEIFDEALSSTGHARHRDALVLRDLAQRQAIELVCHRRVDDPELARMVAACAAVVLPHRHGSHSGWLEVCRDLGVPVVVPRVGFLWQQWVAALSGPVVGAEFDPALTVRGRSLTSALRHVLGGFSPVPNRQEAATTAAVRLWHQQLYQRVRDGGMS